MKNIIQLLVLIALVILSACKSENSTKPDEQVNNVKKTVTTEEKEKTNEEILELEALRLRAGGSVKSAILNGEKAVINYVKDYQEYKSINPQSRVTEEDLKSYWSTGKAIKKALVDGSVKLIKKIDFINETEIVLPFEGKTYKINVSKEKLSKFTGQSFEELNSDFSKNFSDKYVYDDKGRDKFFNHFGTIK
jgi:hypothetical protein